MLRRTFIILAASAVAFGQTHTKTGSKTGYAPVNGLKLYYEIRGGGEPLILLHGGLGATEMFGKPHCGEAGMIMAVHRITFTLAAGTIRELAQNIGGKIGRPVVDKTGITEKFDFRVEFATEGADPSDCLAAPSIFTALGKLGLKLEAAKGPRDFLVIDHVEKPSEN